MVDIVVGLTRGGRREEGGGHHRGWMEADGVSHPDSSVLPHPSVSHKHTLNSGGEDREIEIQLNIFNWSKNLFMILTEDRKSYKS